MIRILAMLVLAFVATGCATDAALRKDAQDMSIYVESVKVNAQEFALARDLVAKARVATLNFLQGNAAVSEQSVQRDVSAREVAQDKEWLLLFASLKRAPDVIAKQRQERAEAEAAAADALAKAKSAVDVRSAKLTEASTSFASLSEKRSREDELGFYQDFFKQVNKSLADKAGNALTQAGEAAAASKAKVGTK